jgi:pimeloyl-ACP methyl ester carboxylesterase
VSRALRLLLAALAVVGVCAAVVYVAYPELILRVVSGAARRSAGLDRRIIEVGGHRIAYLDGGSGPTVVLLHGFGASKDLWNAVAGELTPGYRVIAPDLPGFGESSIRETERYDAESQALLVRSFLDALGVRDHHLGGNSMGGSIAAVYAVTHPRAVSSLLIGAAPGVRSLEKSDFERRLEAGENPMLMRDEDDVDALMELAFFRPPSIPGPLKRAMLDITIRNHAAHARIFDDFTQAGHGALEPLLSRISARTLVVWGAGDRIVHPSSVDVFTKAIAGSERVVFEECGHALPRECPDLLAERYLAFLESGS